MTFSPPFASEPYGAVVDTTTESATPKSVVVFPGEGASRVLDAGAVMQVRLTALASSDDGKRALYERVGLFVFPVGGTLAQVGATTDVVTIEDDAAWDVALSISGGVRFAAVITGAAAPVITRWKLRMEVLMGRAF